MAPPPKRRRSTAKPGLDNPKVLDEPGRPRKAAAESDKLDEDDSSEQRLRFVDVLTELPNGDAAAATELSLPGRGLTDVDSLESCRNLRKLELKDNRLTDLGFLEMNHELCWLGAAQNRIERIRGLDNLASLAVLDLSDNQLSRLEGLAGLSGLKALIAARNRITRIEGLSPKRNPLLETLVLSHNQISECHMAPFPSLKKLSLAQNQMHAFPGLATLPQLTELRLNGNRISALSGDISRQPRLSIVDVGNNLMQKAESLEPLRGLLWIKSLNLFGNAVAQDMESEALKGIMASLPRLEILNNRRLEKPGTNGKKKERQRSNGNAKHARQAPKATPVPAKIEVHGRNFEGRRSVFDEDEESDTKHRAVGKSSMRIGDTSVNKRDKARRKKRKTVEHPLPSSNDMLMIDRDASAKPAPAMPRKVKKKVKRRMF